MNEVEKSSDGRSDVMQSDVDLSRTCPMRRQSHHVTRQGSSGTWQAQPGTAMIRMAATADRHLREVRSYIQQWYSRQYIEWYHYILASGVPVLIVVIVGPPDAAA